MTEEERADARARIAQYWIKLNRYFLDDPDHRDAPEGCGQVMIKCTLFANRKTEEWFDGRADIVIPAGSFVLSYVELADAAQCTRPEVREALRYLQKVGLVTTKVTIRYSLVTVCNWADYQAAGLD